MMLTLWQALVRFVACPPEPPPAPPMAEFGLRPHRPRRAIAPSTFVPLERRRRR